MGQVTLISGRERRRRWSAEDHARILAAVCEPGAIVAEIARREDICTSLVYKWRREARAVSSQTEFAPVLVEATSAPSLAMGSLGEAAVIVVEAHDARVRICAGAPTGLVAAVLKALRA